MSTSGTITMSTNPLVFRTPSPYACRKMLDLQHQYNNCTTIPHMRMGLTYWGPPSCAGLLYSCCIGVVQESNPLLVIQLLTFLSFLDFLQQEMNDKKIFRVLILMPLIVSTSPCF
jgi:hypothetical protein